MDSALCLHRGALHIPSTTSRAAGLARPYSSFEPSSLSLFPKASTYPTLSRHTFCSPVICVLNQPSPPSPNYDKDNGKRIVIMVGGASVVLACVLGVINYNFNFIPTAIAGQKKSLSRTHKERPEEPVVVSRPEEVLDSLLKVNRHLCNQKKRNKIGPSISRMFKSTKLLPSIPDRPTKEHFDNLKIAVADLIKSGKCDEAETKLRGLYENIQGSEVKYNVEMELVLVLIFQGKYEEALKCRCLSHDARVGGDGRFPYYKAIIYTMLSGDARDKAERDKAEKYSQKAQMYWQQFFNSFSSQPPILVEVPTPKSERPQR
ncbi:uncharacterized protein LOC133733205 [Rosa rugosa]|uniref:uncharacterized protein LOC133733205 n=1 Tax=Rosa rugosa TaxID=74645 RepID=UPI002B409A4F|nr:uncharacterized protein LOC133733205 [Rosa rugosa]